MNLKIGDKVLYRKDDKLYEGVIKSIQDNKIEIDESTIKLVIAAISKNTIADNLTFKKQSDITEIPKTWNCQNPDVNDASLHSCEICHSLYPSYYDVCRSQKKKSMVKK